MSRAFRRDLDQGFMDRLKDGALRPLLHLTFNHHLDVQLRGKYINLYCDGQAVLKLTDVPRKHEYEVEIDPEYLVGVQLPCRTGPRTHRLTTEQVDHWIAEYGRQIDAICANARHCGGRETTAEQALIRTSLLPDSPVVLIDRQVAAPGPNRSEADVVGLLRADPSVFILGEAKYGGNPEIRCLPSQLNDYYPMFAGTDGLLREDMVLSYGKVVTQKRLLGLLPDDVVFPAAAPRVECLIILCDLGDNGRLLDEAKARASLCAVPLWYVTVCGPKYPVPPREEWQPLCP